MPADRTHIYHPANNRMTKKTKPTVKPGDIGLPKEELNKWMKSRMAWSHTDWLDLLGALHEKGYAELVDTDQGRCEIGKYLEEKRLTRLKMPKAHLKKWLKKHRIWDHGLWEELLDELRKKGHSQLVDTPIGRELLGRYLQEHRR